MKRIISLLMAVLTVALPLISCAPHEDQLDPAITLASSDALTYAQWLDERLETIPDDVTVGMGSNAAYGIDMSSFESDGYIVREMDGDVLIFGATADGLDRAVRKYAKAVESGESANLDVVYHEGYRIGKITLAGRDISEYTVYYPADDEYMKKGADEFVRLIGIACGAVVATSTEEAKAPYIRFEYVHDESLHTVGYRYSVTEDGMVIQCSDGYKNTSPLYATWRVLENLLDWKYLTYGNSDLTVADEVVIPAGAEGTETNAFEEFYHSGTYSFDTYENIRTGANQSTGFGYAYSAIGHACHGIQGAGFGVEASNADNWGDADSLPCFTGELFTEYSIQDIRAYIEKRYVEGQPLFVDIAHPDSPEWCLCRDCVKLYRMHGNTHAAPVVYWANIVAETFVPEYPGICFGIFGYWGTNKPPERMDVHDSIYVTYCFDQCCTNHPIDGSECTTGEPIVDVSGTRPTSASATMSGYLEGWLEIASNVHVWHYALPDALLSMSVLHTVRKDFQYFYEVGVKGVVWENEEDSFSSKRVSRYIFAALQWNIDMTEEEEQEVYWDALYNLYGDAADNVDAYFDVMTIAYKDAPCSGCWWWSREISPTYNFEYYDQQYDRQFEVIEAAVPLADSAKQERRLIYLTCENIYKGSLASYFRAYEAYDDERCEVLKERYLLINERLLKYGIKMNEKMPSCWNGGFIMVYATTLERQAWRSTYWQRYCEDWLGIKLTRPEPAGLDEPSSESVESESAS